MKSTGVRYLVAGCMPWNRLVFDEAIRRLSGEWTYVETPEDLIAVLAGALIRPRYVFFLHWRWKVPSAIVESYECINFHMTDLPYGRGGSPLQNLILAGHTTSRLTAHRMTDRIDAGPIYLKADLRLDGTAQEILVRATWLSHKMIEEIVRDELEPVPQEGPVVSFKRRTPEQSAIPALSTIDELYDFIRMLDSDGYPRAFIDFAGFRFEFGSAVREPGRLAAEVSVTRLDGPRP